MKFLQTGDWHLGKIFHETSLIPDQEAFLSQITAELSNAQNDKKPYDALIVPGDIYDRSVPPSEAVTLLSTFLTNTHRTFSRLHIFILSGNHDSADRLSFASQILADDNIHICTDTSHLTDPVIVGKGNGAAAVYQIPFLHPGEIRRGNEADAAVLSEEGSQPDLFSGHESFQNVPVLRTQQELITEAAVRIQKYHHKTYADLPAVVCAHLFTTTGRVSNSERSCVGTAEQVDADIFSRFSYTALGHLHGVQKVGKKSNVWYSGAPLAYSFDDSPETFMLSVCIEKDKEQETVLVNKLPFIPLHKVIRLEGPFEKFYGKESDRQIISTNSENYVEIICTDNSVPENPMVLLRQNFHNILSFRKQDSLPGGSNTTMENRRKVIESDSVDKPEKLFDLFIHDVYGNKVPSGKDFTDERKLFLKLAENYSWTEEQT
ncbi:MAG: exonuclease subunit SbcD [Treponema sp.]|nr:exonuclease subunit SbcD [Treponema sp.]